MRTKARLKSNHLGTSLFVREIEADDRSGSDYTSFLQRYGVASGDIGYSYGPNSAVYHYHSIYDSFTWQEK